MTKSGCRLQTAGEIQYWTFPMLEQLGLCRTAIFLRHGGISRDKYASLNLGLHTGDDPVCVRENRKRAITAAGMGPFCPVLGQQTHGTGLQVVNISDQGKGWNDCNDALPDTDGLLTAETGLPLGIMTADCIPLIFAADNGKAIGIIHVGWRGLVQGIIEQTINKFNLEYGIISSRLLVGIGPGIGKNAFEVNGEALASLRTFSKNDVIYNIFKNKHYFDILMAIKRNVWLFGVKIDKIYAINECTMSYSDKYFSYRRDGNTGRMMAIVQKI